MYSAEEHLYCSAQPSVFSHIVLNDDANNFRSFNSSTERLLFGVVVAASFLISSEKNETLHDVDMILWTSLFLPMVMH